MIIIKKDPNEYKGPLVNFLSKNLPETLILTENYDGYDVDYFIETKERIDSIFGIIPTKLKIATASNNKIILKQPQYYSDIVDLLEQYEKKIGNECTLIVCES